MTRNVNRWGWGLALLVVTLAAVEVGLNLWMGTRAAVEVWNDGSEPVEDLVVTLGSDRVEVPRLAAGDATVVRLGGSGHRTLVLRFRQRGNALGTFELPGFDPAQVRSDGMKQVIRLRPNEIERYLDDDDVPATPAGRLAKLAKQGFEDSLNEMASPR
ncbi:MAG: hypothetical protein AB7I30_19875 [Isosphaeraceae bacterium]